MSRERARNAAPSAPSVPPAVCITPPWPSTLNTRSPERRPYTPSADDCARADAPRAIRAHATHHATLTATLRIAIEGGDRSTHGPLRLCHSGTAW
jgi:hypothetical protein